MTPERGRTYTAEEVEAFLEDRTLRGWWSVRLPGDHGWRGPWRAQVTPEPGGLYAYCGGYDVGRAVRDPDER